ncbi:UvrD-helicase domain-containing protein, partial [bacterium]|nr:UvrD-helicase domain-containing protein [bacterium]
MKSFLDELNPVQQEAVQATQGPVLILAGAGSGKTRVLTYRIAHLVEHLKADPASILAVTFTKKAAQEMRERVIRLIGYQPASWIGTFHSIFSKILRQESRAYGYTPDFVIYDSDDQNRLIKSILEQKTLSAKVHDPRSIGSAISRAKNDLIGPDVYAQSVKSPFEETVAAVYPEYQKQLRQNQAFDFDDLITVPLWIFEKYPEVLERYRDRFEFIHVDEYQDTNRAQYRLIQSLARFSRNLCVVGDDDQSIYMWRGADIRNILDFERDFPDARVFRLEQNYRSTQNILKAAHSVVRNNARRKHKELWTRRETGEAVEYLEMMDEREEAYKVVEKIQEQVFKHKRTFRDFAILYRTHAQSRALEDGLRRSGMSYVIVGGLRFYERKEIKDMLAYLRLIVNPADSVSLKRIINFPPRGIGETTLARIEKWAINRQIPLLEAVRQAESITDIPARIQASVSGFYRLIRKYSDLAGKVSPGDIVHALVEDVGLINLYKNDATPEGQTRLENIREFLSAFREYVEETEKPSLTGFLEEVSLVTDVDRWNDKANAITLMTLHSAKGLEFPVVFITGLEEGLFPTYRSLEDADSLEEERRLFYVGMTRSMEKVYLFSTRMRSLYGGGGSCRPSRFLDEIDHSILERSRSGEAPVSRRWRRKAASLDGYFESHPDYESAPQEVSP